MDFFYDGQIRRVVTQFMRVFIGFKYRTGGVNSEDRYAPVMYGDMSRQVASIISENSENKQPTVPRIACYINSLELDRERLADSTFVSKLHIRERDYNVVDGKREYLHTQGGNYTVERLMPTPFKITFKTDIWTSNTDQKLQFLEQILVLFNPSLDLQMTDNFVDWTSLTTLTLTNINFSSRTIPQGAESEIDICTLEFEAPIWISPPAKVKKMGIIKNIVMNIFTETGDVADLKDLVLTGEPANLQLRETVDRHSILLLRNPKTGKYECSAIAPNDGVIDSRFDTPEQISSLRVDWNKILEIQNNFTGTSRICFLQPNGYEISGTFTLNVVDPTFLIVDLDPDTIPSNTDPAITGIIDPYSFNPVAKFKHRANIPVGSRYLILDGINTSSNVGKPGYDGPDGWKDIFGEELVVEKYSIIEWNGSSWVETFKPSQVGDELHYVTNLKTGIQYKWIGKEWVKSFEGEYAAGYWRFDLD